MDQPATAEWKAYLKNYETQKTNVAWKTQPPVQRVRMADVKRLEAMYNPILQTYSDPSTESRVQAEERKAFVSTLAQNKDRALRYEQTYNVVNLENKLIGLEGKPGYPVEKPPNYDKHDVCSTSVPYNLLSNKDFKEHHYLPPDKRPDPPEQKAAVHTISAVEYRDYDIITGRYIRNHEEKVGEDQKAYKAEAAEKYWKTHDYDLLKGKFIDEEKEREFEEKRKAEALLHGLDRVDRLPDGVKYSESSLYQPINMQVVDEARLREIDERRRNAKKRYESRFDLEREYRVRSIQHRDVEEQERQKTLRINRVNAQRFLEVRDRGYNIITHSPFEGRFAEELPVPYVQPKPSVWERTLMEAKPAQERAASAQPENPIRFVDNGKEVVNPSPVATPKPRVLRSSGFRTVHAA